MRKLNFFKTLLLAAGLLMGANAWAETYSGTVSFEAKSRSTYADGTFTTANNAGNGYALAIADLSGLDNIASATSVTIEFDVTVSGRLLIGIGDKNKRGTNANGSNKSTYNTDGLVMRYGTSDGNTFRVNGGTNNSNLKGVSSHVLFTLDRTNGKYSYTITYVDGNSETQTGLSGSNLATSVSNATIVEAYSWNNNQSNALSSVSYSYEYSTAAFDYSVKAVTVGGSNISELASGTSNEAVTVSYPRAIKVGEVWYTCPSTNNFSVEATALNPNPTIVYTADESIVYFSEAEAITSSQVVSSASCSGGSYVNYYAGPKSVSFNTAGKYELETNVASRNANSSLEVYTEEGTESVAQIAKNGTLGIRTCQFDVEIANSIMRVGGPYYNDKFQNSLGFDYILIRAINQKNTITDAGYATCCSPYALDFSSVDGLTAYIATATKDKVSFSEVKSAPANTGILLKGEAKAYDIPVVSSSGTDVSNNVFVGVTEATIIAAEAGYVLMGSPSVGFYKNNNAFTVGANTAYIPLVNIPAEARVLSFIGFEDETTGIKAIENGEWRTGNCYNLNGQRIAKPSKGLYIQNGKKMLMK